MPPPPRTQAWPSPTSAPERLHPGYRIHEGDKILAMMLVSGSLGTVDAQAFPNLRHRALLFLLLLLRILIFLILTRAVELAPPVVAFKRRPGRTSSLPSMKFGELLCN
jgi:hypothetical protein